MKPLLSATRILTIPTLLLVGVLLAGCQPGAEPSSAAAAKPEPAVPVLVERAQRRDFAVTVDAIGWVESYARVVVRPQVSGQLQELHFTEGQLMERGQLLATIDPRPFDAALQLAEANRARDFATAENARAEAERLAGLFARGQASDRERDEARFNAESRQAQVRAIDAQIARAKIDLDYCQIHSPIEGRAGERLLDSGNIVEANASDLLVINQLSPIFVKFSVPEQYLNQVQQALETNSGDVVVHTDDIAERLEVGKLTFVDNEVDVATGMIPLKATFENAERRLWPGRFVRTAITLSTLRDVVVVPAAAVQPGQNRPFVYVVQPDETVASLPVVAGITANGMTVIQNGLNGDEQVVTDGHLRLTPGALISRKATPTSGPAPRSVADTVSPDSQPASAPADEAPPPAPSPTSAPAAVDSGETP